MKTSGRRSGVKDLTAKEVTAKRVKGGLMPTKDSSAEPSGATGSNTITGLLVGDPVTVAKVAGNAVGAVAQGIGRVL